MRLPSPQGEGQGGATRAGCKDGGPVELRNHRHVPRPSPTPPSSQAEAKRDENARGPAHRSGRGHACPLPTFALYLCLCGGLRYGCAELYDGGLEDLDLHVIRARSRGLGGLRSRAGKLAFAGVEVCFGIPYGRRGETAALAIHTRDRGPVALLCLENRQHLVANVHDRRVQLVWIAVNRNHPYERS